jgi:hypothetical protein
VTATGPGVEWQTTLWCQRLGRRTAQRRPGLAVWIEVPMIALVTHHTLEEGASPRSFNHLLQK